MRPGLRESIEPLGADGGNVGARPGVEPCSDGLELVELGRIGVNWANSGRLRAPKRTPPTVCIQGMRAGWDRPPVDPLLERTQPLAWRMEALDSVIWCHTVR